MKQTILTEEQINDNKKKFLDVLTTAASNRSGCDVDRLVKFLEESDFFVAPASTKFHNSFKGGLCDHSLNVYRCLMSLVVMNGLENTISQDSVAIVALLHDISKRNFYEECFSNKKVYNANGKKYDEGGRFDWEVEKSYKTRDYDNRLIFSNHECTSEYMVSKLIPITMEESAAIMHHHGGVGFECTAVNIPDIYSKYPLACLLHLADMNATCIIENEGCR